MPSPEDLQGSGAPGAPGAGKQEGVEHPDTDTTWWTNHYRCPDCRHQWADGWDCQVDDDCPECGLRHISPYYSDDGSGSEEDRERALQAADERLQRELEAQGQADAAPAPARGG